MKDNDETVWRKELTKNAARPVDERDTVEVPARPTIEEIRQDGVVHGTGSARILTWLMVGGGAILLITGIVAVVNWLSKPN